jgi:hypothetical protein
MNIILKARQLGLSWLALAYGLWLTNCNRGRTVLILNRNLEAAQELLARVKYIHDRLPPWLQAAATTDNTRVLEFGEMDSRIISLPTTEHSGSGMTSSLIILDEWAKLRWTEQLWASIEPTLSAGGQLIGIATAQGYHGQFARMWRDAVDGVNELHATFLPWMAHPDRTQEWYAQQVKNYRAVSRKDGGIRLLKREYPETPQEAFSTSGLEVFGDEWDRESMVIGGEQVPDGCEVWPVWRGIDFGFHFSPCLWIRVEQKRTAVVFAELDAQEMTTTELAQGILAVERRLHLPTSKIRSGVDPAGRARTSVGVPDMQILANAGIKSQYKIVTPADRVMLMKTLLREGRLFFHHSCSMVIEAMERALWETVSKNDDQPKETYAKDGLYDHYLDGLSYGLVVIFPPKGAKAIGKRADQTLVPKRYEYESGALGRSEF